MIIGQRLVWLEGRVDGYPPDGVIVLCADHRDETFFISARSPLPGSVIGADGVRFWRDFEHCGYYADEAVSFYAYIPQPPWSK